jgi:hypothetical protein
MVDVLKIPSKDTFDEDAIAAYVVGVQNNRKGQHLMAAGDVTGITFADGLFRGFVHAEKTGDMNYEVSVQFDATHHIGDVKCSCAGRTRSHHRCKHTAAILYALLALKNYPHNADKPRWGHRVGLKRFTKGMPAAFRAAVGADKTWSQIVAETVASTPAEADADAPKTKKRSREQADNSDKRTRGQTDTHE